MIETLSPGWLSKLREIYFIDKGYISNALFNELADRGLLLVTSIKKNMKFTMLLSFA